VSKVEKEDLAKPVLTRMGKNIRFLRRERKWTQEVLAEKASINDKELSHIESGNRNITIETLVKITYAFEINPPLTN